MRPFVLLLIVLTACGGSAAASSTGGGGTSPPASGTPGQVHVEAGDKIGGDGTLDVQAVRGALESHLDAVTACYRRELERDAFLHGRVIVEFSVTRTGAVSEIMARADGIGDPGVASCASGMVSGLTLPAPTSGDVRFRFPFVFEP